MRIRKKAVVLILLALSMLATAGLYADFQSGYYALTGAPSLAQEAPPKLSFAGNYEVGVTRFTRQSSLQGTASKK